MNYKIVNQNDGNVEFDLNSSTENEAALEALELLGYSLVEVKSSKNLNPFHIKGN